MSSDKNVLKVKIYGVEYAISGHSDANQLKMVADYVDAKMREIDESGARVDSSLKRAILAALNIVDELMQERASHEKTRRQLEDKIDKLTKRIEETISDKSD